jgi:hypothetical protein
MEKACRLQGMDVSVLCFLAWLEETEPLGREPDLGLQLMNFLVA